MASHRGIVVAPISVGDILQNTTTVTVGANVLGKILFVTPNIEKLFGYTADEITGQNITILMPERFKEMHAKGFQNWVDTGNMQYAGKEIKAYGRRKDGREIPVSLTLGSYYDGPDIRAVATIKDVRDIIVLEETTEMMRQELNHTRALTENIGIGIFTTDRNGTILSANPMAEDLVGYNEDEIIGLSGHDVLHKFNPDGSIENIKDCAIMNTLKTETVRMVIDDYFLKKDGTFLNVDITIAPMIRDKKVIGLVISFQDISDRKKREQALRESEERYKTLVEFSPDPICVYANGRFVYANQSGLRMVGATAIEDVVDRQVLDFIHPDYHQIVSERMRQVMETWRPTPLLHEKVLRLDGSPIDVEVASMPIIYNHSPAALAVIRDITERLMQDKRYEIITQNAMDLIAMTGMDGKITFANHPAHHLILGYDKGELIGTELRSLVHPDDTSAEDRRVALREELERGEKIPQLRRRMRHKDGHWVWVEGTGALITQGNNVAYFLSTVHDITEQMDREKHIDQFLNAIPQLVWTAESDGNIYWYNNNWYEYTGQTLEEAKNDGWKAVHHPDHIDRVVKEWQHSIDTGEPLTIQFPLRRHDGAYRWFLTKANPIYEDTELVRWVGTNTDIDDSRRAYEDKSRLSIVTELSQSAIIGKNLDGTIISWNPAAERIYGYTQEEVLGKNISIIVPKNKLTELDGIMAKLTRGEQVIDLETRRKTKDGKILRVSLIVLPIKDMDGTIVGASAIATPLEEK